MRSRSPAAPGCRIALTFASLSGGGMERSMLRLAEGLMARGHAVDLVIGQAKGELLSQVPAGARIVELAKVPVLRAWRRVLAGDPALCRLLLRPKSRVRMLKPVVRRLPSLVAYLRKARPDALLAAEPRYNVTAAWARRMCGLPARVVVSERIQVSHHATSGGPWSDPRLRDLLRDAYLSADAIVAVSDGVADDLAAHADIPRERITTVYNPVVGPELLAGAEEQPGHAWLALGQPPVILAAGRLDPQKDFATLIRAFARVRAHRPARLVILGAPSLARPAHAGELAALADRLGIADDVDMPGFVDNPFAFMARAAAFVLSSQYEGLPGVLIQAMACGCPVASTDCPSGPAEILDHGRLGPLVPVGDDAAMACAIEDLLEQPPAPALLRRRAARFSVERAVDDHLALLLPAPREALPRRVAASPG